MGFAEPMDMLTTASASSLVARGNRGDLSVKYIKLTEDILMNAQPVDTGTVLALDDSDGAVGNILSAQRGVLVDEDAYKAFQRAGSKSKAAA